MGIASSVLCFGWSKIKLGAGFAPIASVWFASPRRCCLEGILTNPSPTTPGPLPPYPNRSGHGCLWGCLFAALIAITAIVGAFSYFGWYFYSGYKENPTLAMVMTVVNGDERARSGLGDNIKITALHS